MLERSATAMVDGRAMRSEALRARCSAGAWHLRLPKFRASPPGAFPGGRAVSGKAAVAVVDMLNRYHHEDAEPLRDAVRAVLPAMADLIDLTRSADGSVVYVNDNHGDCTAGSGGDGGLGTRRRGSGAGRADRAGPRFAVPRQDPPGSAALRMMKRNMRATWSTPSGSAG
jgi:hypothetical protein